VHAARLVLHAIAACSDVRVWCRHLGATNQIRCTIIIAPVRRQQSTALRGGMTAITARELAKISRSVLLDPSGTNGVLELVVGTLQEILPM